MTKKNAEKKNKKHGSANSQKQAVMTELKVAQSLLLDESNGGKDTVLLIRSKGMGEGDAEFGERLLQDYLRALQELVDVNGTIILYQEAVKLTQKTHPTSRLLESLVRPGIEILVCRRSLAHYELALDAESKLKDATILTIACRIHEADKVITI